MNTLFTRSGLMAALVCGLMATGAAAQTTPSPLPATASTVQAAPGVPAQAKKKRTKPPTMKSYERRLKKYQADGVVTAEEQSKLDRMKHRIERKSKKNQTSAR